MTAWQYAQLSITRDIRASEIRTILWRAPGTTVPVRDLNILNGGGYGPSCLRNWSAPGSGAEQPAAGSSARSGGHRRGLACGPELPGREPGRPSGPVTQPSPV
jgi:hypothetical protein